MSIEPIALNSPSPAAAPAAAPPAISTSAPPSPPTAINPPVTPPPDTTIRAAITINDGSKIPFRFVDDPNLPPLQRLQARFNALIVFSRSYRPEVVKELAFFDKALYALYKLNTLIENDLGTEQISELDTYIEKNVRGLPEYPYLEIILIRTLFSKQKISEAEADQRFQHLISKYRGSEQIWLSYVQFLTESNRPNPAVAIFCKFLKSRYPELVLLNRSDLIAKAIETIDRWDHLSILGDLLFNQGDSGGSLSILKQSEACFKRALELVRHPAQKLLLQQKLGNLYLVLAGMTGDKEYAENAIPCFVALLQREPQNPIYLTWLGDSFQLLYEITGEEEPAAAAKQYFRQALEVPGRPPEIALHLAEIYLRENKPEAAVAIIEKELKAHSDVPALRMFLADLYAVDGRFDQALASVKKAFEVARSNPVLLYQLYAQFERSRFGLKVKLAQMEARVPGNPAGAVFSALGRAISMANPLNTVIAIATGNVPHYSQEELEDYLAELERVHDQVYDRYQQDHTAVDFYLINLMLFDEIKSVLSLEKEKASRALGGTEYESSMSKLKEECATEEDRNLEWMKTFLNVRTENAAGEERIGLLRARFANFTKLSLLIEQSPALQEELKAVRDTLWTKLIDDLNDALDNVEDENDKTSLGQLLQVLDEFAKNRTQLGDHLPLSREQEEGFGRAMYRVFEIRIQIAVEEKDYQQLFGIGQAVSKNTSVLAYKALSEAYDLAEDDDNFEMMWNVAIYAFRAALPGREIFERQRELFLNLYLDAADDLADHYEETGQDKELRQLISNHWRLGKQEEAIELLEDLIDRTEDKKELLTDLAYMHSVRDQSEDTEERSKAVIALYQHWFGDDPMVYELEIAERKISKIVIVKNGYRGPAKEETIIREMGYAGVKAGEVFDREETQEAIAFACRRLQTFSNYDLRYITDPVTGEITIEVNINEVPPYYIEAMGSGGNIAASVSLGAGTGDLLGGGETLGGRASYYWFYAEGFKNMELIGGQVFYKDPHLFKIGEDMPVSFGITGERTLAPDYETHGVEIENGGKVSFGIQLNRNTKLSLTPSTYYVEDDNLPNHIRSGIRAGIEHDTRDTWRFTSSGHLVKFYVEPGVYYGGIPTTGYVKTGVSAQQYFPLPADFVVMLGAKGDIGHNLMGSNVFSLGGGKYVRGQNYLDELGQAAVGAQAEIRTPAIGQIWQPYLFVDGGVVFGKSWKPRPGFGLGGGMRFAIPYVGVVNLYYGWPCGFGFGLESAYSGE